MGSWTQFEREYNITPQDWVEWHVRKREFRKGSWHRCPKCGVLIRLSPLLTFLLYKGKKSPYCFECEKQRRGKTTARKT